MNPLYFYCTVFKLVGNILSNYSTNGVPKTPQNIALKAFSELYLLKMKLAIRKTSKFIPIKAEEELNQLNENNSKVYKI